MIADAKRLYDPQWRASTHRDREATSRYFAFKPIELVGTAVTAVVGDESGVGPAARGWLEEVGFRVRRRITPDPAAALQASGA